MSGDAARMMLANVLMRRPQQPDQADFLRSEKDTRPYEDTYTRGNILPFGMSGYNMRAEVAMPGLVHSAINGLNAPRNALAGNIPQWDYDPRTGETHTSEAMDHAGMDAAGLAATGGFAVPRRAAVQAAANTSEANAPSMAVQAGRKVDPLGYYSKLDEVLGSFKPTDTVTAQTLAQRGVKASELQARGLDGLLSKGGVKVQDLIGQATEPVRVNESVYAGSAGKFRYGADGNHTIGEPVIPDGAKGSPKWKQYSLDGGSNPTYRETVLHLPPTSTVTEQWSITAPDGHVRGRLPSEAAAREAMSPGDTIARLSDANVPSSFQSGHWSEPNAIAHMRTSIQRDAQGRPVFHVDELQSDWGQKIRDGGGVRDEAKIAELQRRADAAGIDLDWLREAGGDWDQAKRNAVEQLGKDTADRMGFGDDRNRLLAAELRGARNATEVGHPLVNTSDQWQTTALRRALRQAVEADAHGIALPSGDTVLGYGMGGEPSGMRYAYDKMYPKVLGRELSKLDPEIQRQAVALAGHEGKGPFTYYPITDKAREAIRAGLPLFANAPEANAPSLAAQAGREQTGIRAYHGSPHDFDAFDLSKIGTGEGAQAFGHGLYFAENEGVAKSYRDQVRSSRPLSGDNSNPAEAYARYRLADSGNDRAAAAASLEQTAKHMRGGVLRKGNAAEAAIYDEAAKLLRDETWNPNLSPGRMYEVNIKADPEHFLDWDKPLSQQSEKVRGAIAAVQPSHLDLLDAIEPYQVRDALEKIGSDRLKPGQPAHAMMDEARKALVDKGIPGIRYLDQHSRTAGQGTSNYVVFDPTIIEILRKYGFLPPAIAAGAAADGLLPGGDR